MSEWKPKQGDIFYWIGSTFTVNRDPYVNGYSRDQELVEAGNCFRTYDEANKALGKFKSIIKEQQTTEQKPKLTVEVFDREDCPAWAKWAAVDADGDTFYYESKPKLEHGIWVNNGLKRTRQTTSHYNLDYKNSLIKRPEKVVFPDWVKPDAIGWHAEEGYFHIFSIDSEKSMATGIYFRRVKYSTNGFFLYRTFVEECSEARCIVDAEDLVGKKVRCTNEVTWLITRCDPINNTIDFGPHKGMSIGRLTESLDYQLVGEIKFKYQHMEDGEWVD